MKDNKKKTIVLAILGVALIAVGAFQFMPKGGGTASVAKSTVKKAANVRTSQSGKNPSAATSATTDSGVPVAGANGASTTNSAVAENETDPQKALLMQMVSKPYPARDPFAPQYKDGTADPNAASTPAPANAAPTQPVRQPVASNGFRRPPPLEGGTKPWEPPVTGGSGLSNPAGSTTPIGGGIGLSKGAPLRQPNEFAYTLKGVLVGNKPMAVFEDDNGNQRLVPLGGSVDGDSKVVGIEKGKVRIRHRGKDQTHTLPEGP